MENDRFVHLKRCSRGKCSQLHNRAVDFGAPKSAFGSNSIHHDESPHQSQWARLGHEDTATSVHRFLLEVGCGIGFFRGASFFLTEGRETYSAGLAWRRLVVSDFRPRP